MVSAVVLIPHRDDLAGVARGVGAWVDRDRVSASPATNGSRHNPGAVESGVQGAGGGVALHLAGVARRVGMVAGGDDLAIALQGRREGRVAVVARWWSVRDAAP